MSTPNPASREPAPEFQSDYELLRDAILENLDDCIQEDDVAEVAIFIAAIERAGAEIKRLSAPALRASETTAPTCAKVLHDVMKVGWLHAADDDSPYDIDGVAYCGRCHVAMAAHPAVSAPRVPEETPE